MALHFSLIGLLLFAGFCKPKAEFSAENNGTVTVYWQNLAVGTLTFARDYETKEVNFVPPENTPGELKLVRESKGAAHIDWLTVNGGNAIPQGAPANWLKKTNTADSDVLDFPRELVFKVAAADRVHLILRARIEPAVISKIPFRYPLVNQPRDFSPDSQFLAYAWENHGSCKYPEKAFFSQWALSGSGHVDAYTTFWVSNDRDHLCVRADFSSDNTRDGDKDYAEVITKTGKKVRHFRISEEHERWGKVHFTYNNMAVHEHKVYEFRIPKSELANDLKIPLAFALYGTSTPSDMNVAISPFGTVLKGQTASQTVTVTRTAGTANLTEFQALDIAAPFSVLNDTCTGASLAGSASCTFDISFAPTTTGDVETPFRIQWKGNDSNGNTTLLIRNVILKATVTADAQNLVAPQLVTPASGSINVKNGSLLIWKNASDGSGSAISQELSICADASFKNCGSISVAAHITASRETLWGLVPLFLFMHRRRFLRNAMAVFLIAIALAGCSTDRFDMAAESAHSTKAYSRYQLSNVSPNTVYYWKINAKNSTNGELSSAVSSFTTGAE
jgi:hypothetical protein